MDGGKGGEMTAGEDGIPVGPQLTHVLQMHLINQGSEPIPHADVQVGSPVGHGGDGGGGL